MGEENGVGRVHGEDPGREDKSEECSRGGAPSSACEARWQNKKVAI